MKTLKELRKESNKTQMQIAKVLGISQQAYATYELDTRTPPIDIINKLADYYGVSTDYILGRSPESKLQSASTEQTILKGAYFHLAKEAQNMELPEEDIKAILDFAKFLNEKNKDKNKDEPK